VLGTAFAFEIDDGTDYLNPVSRALHAFALERGVLLRPLGNTVYLLPPYCSTEADLGHAYSVVAEFLESR
jgi:adenosylmethionine-8-amino-7-oxononanoate aminotransferase